MYGGPPNTRTGRAAQVRSSLWYVHLIEGAQRAQSGLFTRLRSTEYLDIESYFASRGLSEKLVAYDIPIDAASHPMRDSTHSVS